MDLEIELRDNKTEFLENKVELTDFKVLEVMNKLRITKIPSKRKRARSMDRIKNLPKNPKYIKKTINNETI